MFICFMVFCFGMGVYSLIKPSNSDYENINIRSEAERQIEDLQKMQKYNFWRNFDK